MMISVGIDVAKGKRTVCILKPYGEIVSKPFDIAHIEKDLSELTSMLLRFEDEVKVIMEAIGIYHLPVLTYLQEKGIFVAVINPYFMKVYRSGDLGKAKTDKIDSRTIANYGIEHWFTMEEFQKSYDVYGELKLLGQQYRHASLVETLDGRYEVKRLDGQTLEQVMWATNHAVLLERVVVEPQTLVIR